MEKLLIKDESGSFEILANKICKGFYTSIPAHYQRNRKLIKYTETDSDDICVMKIGNWCFVAVDGLSDLPKNQGIIFIINKSSDINEILKYLEDIGEWKTIIIQAHLMATATTVEDVKNNSIIKPTFSKVHYETENN